MVGTKADIRRFCKEWAGRGDEKQDTELFWAGIMQDVLGLDDALRRLKFQERADTDAGTGHVGYADVYIPSAKAVVEQKSLGVDLDKPEQRQGRMVTPTLSFLTA